jgi:X-X-X-Leu-X-X-Gly heptad repeat protein
VIRAESFDLKGPRGRVFQDVTFAAPAGSLVAIEGPSGFGRTCLLLALTERMRATAGIAEVRGQPLPRHMARVRRFAALGPVAGVAELPSASGGADTLDNGVSRLYSGTNTLSGGLYKLETGDELPRRGTTPSDQRRRTPAGLAGLRRTHSLHSRGAYPHRVVGPPQAGVDAGPAPPGADLVTPCEGESTA